MPAVLKTYCQTWRKRLENNENLRYAISAIIRIMINDESSAYKTETTLDMAEKEDDSADMPRDIILALIHELQVVTKMIAEKADVTREELNLFLKERKLIKTENYDSIDRVIDDLFAEDGDEENNPDLPS